VDGDLDVGHTAATNSHQNSWWQTDLQSVQTISSITVWGRTDCCPAMTSDYYVFVSDTPFTSTDLSTTLSQSGVSNYYHSGFSGPTSSSGATSVNINRTGRYLRVQLTGTNSLALAEVQVWSQAAKLEWLVTDQLGTPRIAADKTGNLAGVSRHDYLPFAEDLSDGRSTVAGYSTADGVRQKFTSKEQDNETGLDYFINRYYTSSQGRFISVDPVKLTPQRMERPQMLNLYAFTINNPLRYTDPDGKDVFLDNDTKNGRRKALLSVTSNLTAAEQRNIGVRTDEDGKREMYVKDPGKINMHTASEGYQQLTNRIGNHDLKIDFTLVEKGSKAFSNILGQNISQQALATGPGGETITQDGKNIEVFVAEGGHKYGVLGLNESGNEVPIAFPEHIISAHELFGETLKYTPGHEQLQQNVVDDNKAVIDVENKIRKFHGLPERSYNGHILTAEVEVRGGRTP
jgi:RHS repeat-associated protein